MYRNKNNGRRVDSVRMYKHWANSSVCDSILSTCCTPTHLYVKADFHLRKYYTTYEGSLKMSSCPDSKILFHHSWWNWSWGKACMAQYSPQELRKINNVHQQNVNFYVTVIPSPHYCQKQGSFSTISIKKTKALSRMAHCMDQSVNSQDSHIDSGTYLPICSKKYKQ